MNKDLILKISALTVMAVVVAVLGWLVAMKEPPEANLKSSTDLRGRTDPNILRSPDEPVELRLKVVVDREGEITANGESMTLLQLDRRFRELAAVDGHVWYFREGGDEAPHPKALSLIKLVAKYELPITLFASPDFSDPQTLPAELAAPAASTTPATAAPSVGERALP